MCVLVENSNTKHVSKSIHNIIPKSNRYNDYPEKATLKSCHLDRDLQKAKKSVAQSPGGKRYRERTPR